MRTGRNTNGRGWLRSSSLDHWDMRTGRNSVAHIGHHERSLDHWDMRTGRNLRQWLHVLVGKSRSLGYAHWPEQKAGLGVPSYESRSLGYAHWPELGRMTYIAGVSLDHWDMRTGRNTTQRRSTSGISLDHWDMRTGRNRGRNSHVDQGSLDHWDMRTGRNAC